MFQILFTPKPAEKCANFLYLLQKLPIMDADFLILGILLTAKDKSQLQIELWISRTLLQKRVNLSHLLPNKFYVDNKYVFKVFNVLPVLLGWFCDLINTYFVPNLNTIDYADCQRQKLATNLKGFFHTTGSQCHKFI